MRWLPWLLLYFLVASALAAQESPSPTSARCTIPAQLADTRPDPDGVPTQVVIDPTVVDIDTVNTAEETFTADFFLILQWQDQRLVDAVHGVSRARCRLKLSEVWHPQVSILNSASLSKQADDTVTVASDGTVKYVQRYSGRLSANFHLREFPFDMQVLPITFVSVEYSPEESLLPCQKRHRNREKARS